MGVDFADLQLALDKNGNVCYDGKIIEEICRASELDISHFRDGPQENIRDLIALWYSEHRKLGGKRDPVAEDLFPE